MKAEALLKRGLLLREKSAAWIAHELHRTLIPKHEKSDTET